MGTLIVVITLGILALMAAALRKSGSPRQNDGSYVASDAGGAESISSHSHGHGHDGGCDCGGDGGGH